MKTWVTCRFTFEGFHRWPNAPDHSAFLRDRHRHLFHVEASLTVEEEDREVEFIEMRSRLLSWRGSAEKNADGCERIAKYFLAVMQDWWPDRQYRVSVFEDGENGATVES